MNTQTGVLRIISLMIIGTMFATPVLGEDRQPGLKASVTEVPGVRRGSNDATAGDQLGSAAAISGDLALVGARGKGDGAAYLYGRDQGGADNWGQLTRLLPDNALPTNARFGDAATLSGVYAAVGAPGANSQAGEVYLFEESGGSWSEVALLTASPATANDEFGTSVALSGDYLLVGAPGDGGSGAVYVWERDGSGTWVANGTLPNSASAGDEYGASVAVNGETAVVGAPRDAGGGSNRGLIYVYQRNAGSGNWNLVTTVAEDSPANNSFFGSAVALSGDNALVGARSGNGGTGAAYVLGRDQGGTDNWGQVRELVPSAIATADRFGFSVGLSGDLALVGAPQYESGAPDARVSGSGGAFLFQRDAGGADQWQEIVKLIPNDANDVFLGQMGHGVAISGATAVLGALNEDQGALTGAGAAYFYELADSCQANLVVPQNQWLMVGIPCVPGGGDTVADVFGDDLSGVYGTDWGIFEWDATNQLHQLVPETGTSLVRGQGYWLKTVNAGETVNISGNHGGQVDIPLVSEATDGRVNLLGHPHNFPFEVCWKDVRVVDGASVLTLSEVDPEVGGQLSCTVNPALAGCVMSRVGYRWNGSSYDTFDGETPGAEGVLGSFDGVWVNAFKAGIQLRIPQLETCAATKALLAPDEWYHRLVVSADGLEDRGNILGHLRGSLDGPDRRDLDEPAPFGSPYLTLVFPHPEWEDRAGDYNVDYRPPAETGEWLLEVRSDQLREVSLRWEAPQGRLSRVVLRDLERGVEIRPQADGSYQFTMVGTRHRLSWRLGPADASVIFRDGF